MGGHAKGCSCSTCGAIADTIASMERPLRPLDSVEQSIALGNAITARIQDAARVEERRVVVAFLRKWSRTIHGGLLADRIERGEHVES